MSFVKFKDPSLMVVIELRIFLLIQIHAQGLHHLGVGGPAGLWHFMYQSIYLDQYVASEFSPPLQDHKQQKRLYRAYQRLYVSMHDKLTGPHKTQFRRDEDYVLLCWITPDFELYASFDPLANKLIGELLFCVSRLGLLAMWSSACSRVELLFEKERTVSLSISSNY